MPEGRPLAAVGLCDFAEDGPFAGVSRLLIDLADAAEQAGLGNLVQAHVTSLGVLSPTLAERYPARQQILTASVPYREAIRSFSSDWAIRHVHGAIDFLFALQDRLGGRPITLVLIHPDRGGWLAGELFRQLARRAGTRPIKLLTSSDEPLPAASLPTGEAEGRYGHQIRQHLAAGRRREAAEQIEAARSACLRRGLVSDALRYAERYLEVIGPDAPEAERARGLNHLWVTLVSAGTDYGWVEGVVKEALAMPLPPAIRANGLYTLAMLHTRFFARPDLRRAEVYMQEALSALGEAPAPDLLAFYRNGLALVLLRQGRTGEALALCQGALTDLEAASASAGQYRLQRSVLLDNLARIHSLRQEYEEAVRYFSLALELDPAYSELYLERGTAQMRQGRFAAALADFEQGIACGPPSAQLHSSRGNILMETGQPAEAVQEFTRALELDDDLAYAHKGRAICLHDLGELQGALADYDAYLARRPDDADSLVNRGSLRHDLGDVAGALADLGEALRRTPANVAALANRAAVLADQGDRAAALRDLEEALRLEPENELLRENYAHLRRPPQG